MMKKLVLLGDSIRMIGYGPVVAENLKDEFETWQPADNGRFSKYTLRYVSYEWVPHIKDADIIHWNNGIWDLVIRFQEDGPFTPIDQYETNVRRIIREMKKLRMSIEELISEARLCGISDVGELEYAILEDNGKLSVFTKKELGGKGIAHVIISDGQINGSGMRAAGLSRSEIEKKLRKKAIPLSSVFLYTVNDKGEENIIVKSEK